jgi:hypothetical protein
MVCHCRTTSIDVSARAGDDIVIARICDNLTASAPVVMVSLPDRW